MPINESLICYATIGTEKMVKRKKKFRFSFWLKKTALIELEKTKRKLIFATEIRIYSQFKL
jgi:hypothetical protein